MYYAHAFGTERAFLARYEKSSLLALVELGKRFVNLNTLCFHLIVEDSNNKLTTKLATVLAEGKREENHDKPDPEKKKDLKALEDIVESVRLSCKELIRL